VARLRFTAEAAPDDASPEWRRFGPRDEHWADLSDPPELAPVYRRRRWEAVRADWGRRNGFGPDAPCAEAEGHRWWEFCHDGPAG
jgi:hypothetical protein